MSRSGFITIIIIVAIVAGAALFTLSQTGFNTERGSDAERVLSGGKEKAATYTDLNGNPVDLSEFEGKVRVVNSWATWCPFCINELPDLSTLAVELDEAEAVVIAINRQEDNARARAFVRSLDGLPGIIFVQDPDDAFYDSIGGFSMPETVFYDADGNVSFHKRGFMELEEMRRHTNTALSATEE